MNDDPKDLLKRGITGLDRYLDKHPEAVAELRDARANLGVADVILTYSEPAVDTPLSKQGRLAAHLESIGSPYELKGLSAIYAFFRASTPKQKANVTRMLKRTKLNLIAWNPSTETVSLKNPPKKKAERAPSEAFAVSRLKLAD